MASSLLIVESDSKATDTPSTPTISPNTSNQNFDIAILFNVVESSGNYIFVQDIHSTVFRDNGYKLCPEGI
jgi:hypothetical protein